MPSRPSGPYLRPPTGQGRDPHLKCITGIFQIVDNVVNGFHPEMTHRPHVTIHIDFGSRVQRRPLPVKFLIDTGADSTLLAPDDAYRILGSNYLSIDFEHDSLSSVSRGIGGYAFSVFRRTRYSLDADDGQILVFDAPIAIAEPLGDPDGRGNWDTPSLLGRDILRFFELHLDYHPSPLVELWYDDDAAAEEIWRRRRWLEILEEYDDARFR